MRSANVPGQLEFLSAVSQGRRHRNSEHDHVDSDDRTYGGLRVQPLPQQHAGHEQGLRSGDAGLSNLEYIAARAKSLPSQPDHRRHRTWRLKDRSTQARLCTSHATSWWASPRASASTSLKKDITIGNQRNLHQRRATLPEHSHSMISRAQQRPIPAGLSDHRHPRHPRHNSQLHDRLPGEYHRTTGG